jgi:hypothetical protein
MKNLKLSNLEKMQQKEMQQVKGGREFTIYTLRKNIKWRKMLVCWNL